MRLLFRLILHRFVQRRFNTTLAVLVLWFLGRVALWVSWGITDEAIFSWIWQYIRGGKGGGMLLEFVANHPILILSIIPILGIVGVLVWMYVDVRKEFRSDYVANTLTEMHERMLQFVSQRLKSVRDNKWLEDAIPELVHKWGVIDIGDWGKFRVRMQKRIRRNVPKEDIRNVSRWFKVASVASKIKQEFMGLKEWTEEDVLIMGGWLDGQGKGLTAIRDRDGKWNKLDKTLRPYMKDSKLRTLIKRHKDYSYAYCSVSLIDHFMDKDRSNPISRMLLNVLKDCCVSKEQVNEDLYKVLDDIRNRMKVLQKQERSDVSRVKV